MILATKGVSQNPGSLDAWLTQNGGYANGCDIYWYTLFLLCQDLCILIICHRGSVDAFGVTHFVGIQQANENEICNGLAAGHGIVANVNGGGHWVLLTGIIIIFL